MFGVCVMLWQGGLAGAQTATSDGSDPVIDLTATRILADLTATATAFPIAPDEVEQVAALAFFLAIASMLIVLGLLVAVIAWMNRQDNTPR